MKSHEEGKQQTLTGDPRIQVAVEELRRLIAGRYPDARFDVFERAGPAGVRLRATVDVEDTDDVMDVVTDALYDIWMERGLAVYVVTGIDCSLHGLWSMLVYGVRRLGPRLLERARRRRKRTPSMS